MDREKNVESEDRGTKHANIEAYVLSTSPLKKSKVGRPYFESIIQTGADDTSKLVGFSSSKRLKIKEFEQNCTPLKLSNVKCQIESTGMKTYLLSDNVPIVGTTVLFEPKAIEHTYIKLEDIALYSVGDDNLRIKACIVKVFPRNVYKGSPVVDTYVAQGGERVKLSLWGDLTNQVTEGKSYLITNVKIRATEPPSISSSMNSELVEIEDVPIDDSDVCEDSTIQIMEGIIISVLSVSWYKSCITCQNAIPEENDANITPEELITCPSCKATCFVVNCEKDGFVKVNFRSNSKETSTLSISASKLSDILDLTNHEENTVKLMLLKAGQLRVTVFNANSSNVIAVSKV